MMDLQINGAGQQLPAGISLAQLLQRLDLASGRVAVELNQEVIPRSLHPQVTLRDGDRIEIVHAIGGG